MTKILLIEDVEDLGRAGDVHEVAPGFARNFLIPKKKAVFASKEIAKLQVKLQEQRAQKAEADKAEAEKLAAKLEGLVLTTTVKVDPEGHMYGSVNVYDVIKLFEQEGYTISKRYLSLEHPYKETGAYNLELNLEEGVKCHCTLKIQSDVVEVETPEVEEENN